jgi:hypothetical protein
VVIGEIRGPTGLADRDRPTEFIPRIEDEWLCAADSSYVATLVIPKTPHASVWESPILQSSRCAPLPYGRPTELVNLGHYPASGVVTTLDASTQWVDYCA